MPELRPQLVHLKDVPVVPIGGPSSGVSLARIITNANHGSRLTFGVHWLEPGSEHPAWIFPEREEVYFVISGRLQLTWEEGVIEVGPHDALFLPPGRHYQYKNIADEGAFFVYTIYPPIA